MSIEWIVRLFSFIHFILIYSILTPYLMTMPVHINEMTIRANVAEPVSQPAQSGAAAQPEVDKEEIIKECTAIILEILNSKHER